MFHVLYRTLTVSNVFMSYVMQNKINLLIQYKDESCILTGPLQHYRKPALGVE